MKEITRQMVLKSVIENSFRFDRWMLKNTFELNRYLKSYGIDLIHKVFLFYLLNLSASVLISYKGKENIYLIAFLGLTLISLELSLYWERFRRVVKSFFENSWKKNIRDFLLGVLIVGLLCVFTSIPIYVLQVVEIKQASETTIGVIFAYPGFVLLQQIIYMWAPNIILAPVSKKWIVFVSALFYALAHGHYGTEIVVVSFLLVGLPCAGLCIYRNNYLVSYLLQLIMGYTGFAMEYV